MPHGIEKASFNLKTINASQINTNKSIITWSNINLRLLLDRLFDKYTKFNLVLKQINTNNVDVVSTATNRQVKICLSGLTFSNNYDTEYKSKFGKVILTSRYYFNTNDNFILKIYKFFQIQVQP